jgi:hypothetical protein
VPLWRVANMEMFKLGRENINQESTFPLFLSSSCTALEMMPVKDRIYVVF